MLRDEPTNGQNYTYQKRRQQQQFCTANRSWPVSSSTMALIINTTDDDCEQQVPTVAPRLQQLTTPAARRRS